MARTEILASNDVRALIAHQLASTPNVQLIKPTSRMIWG
jgi:hypothetical protein